MKEENSYYDNKLKDKVERKKQIVYHMKKNMKKYFLTEKNITK